MDRSKVDELKEAGGIDSIQHSSPDDLFLVCASYEPRSITTAECLAETYRAKKGIIYLNKEFLENRSRDKVQANINTLDKILSQYCEQVFQVRGSWLDPAHQFISLRDAMVPEDSESFYQGQRITLDSTTFNREALLATMVLLYAHYPKAQIRITYVSPGNHGEWLSRGFRAVRSVIGFPGVQEPTRPTVVVGLSGFEPERLMKVIEEYEPQKVLLGIGDPPTAEKFLKRNQEEQKLVLGRQDVEEFRFPADSIKRCAECLEGLLSTYIAEYNVILAPMSTKLSTVATFLVAERCAEIQVAYCVPGEYNVDDYSTGAESLYIEDVIYDE